MNETEYVSEEMLEEVRVYVKSALSPKRAAHVFAVEKAAVRLGQLYLPSELMELRAAALLHDITKEYSIERHLEILSRFGCEATETELYAPKTLHAKTAALLIPELFPRLAQAEIVSAVRNHTTGCAGMSLFDMLIYLADYIDETRTFGDCVKLRNAFEGARPDSLAYADRIKLLRRIMATSLDMTLVALIADGAPIHPDTVAARNELVLTIKKENEEIEK